MNIFILHRIPYVKIEYHRGIDHDEHQVIYFGSKESLRSIPNDLSCTKITRTDGKSTVQDAIDVINSQDLSIDLVLSLSEYELMDAAQIRESLNIEGPKPQQVLLVRDKLAMKAKVSECGIDVPKCFSLLEYINNEVYLPGKLIVKPIDGASSENVITYQNDGSLRASLESRQTGIFQLDNSDLTGFEVEEFIEGSILHFDGLIHEGKIEVITASEYLGNCLNYANGFPLASCQYFLNEIELEWCKKVLHSTEITNGSFHLEAIRYGKRLIFLEVANRVGGADVVRTFEYATGIHMPSEELKIYTQSYRGLNPKDPSERKYFGWFVFPGHKYNSESVLVNDSIKTDIAASILHWHTLAIDTPTVKHITYQAHEVPVAGILGHKDPDALKSILERVLKEVRVYEQSNEDLGALVN